MLFRLRASAVTQTPGFLRACSHHSPERIPWPLPPLLSTRTSLQARGPYLSPHPFPQLLQPATRDEGSRRPGSRRQYHLTTRDVRPFTELALGEAPGLFECSSRDSSHFSRGVQRKPRAEEKRGGTSDLALRPPLPRLRRRKWSAGGLGVCSWLSLLSLDFVCVLPMSSFSCRAVCFWLLLLFFWGLYLLERVSLEGEAVGSSEVCKPVASCPQIGWRASWGLCSLVSSTVPVVSKLIVGQYHGPRYRTG